MTISQIADQIYQADISKISIKPIRSQLQEKDIQSAYKIQRHNIRRQLDQGKKIVGKKIGLTSKRVQAQLGVNQPDFGVLLNTMQIKNKASLPYSDLMQPKAEAEIAFILKTDLNQKYIQLTDVIKAIDFVSPAIEIVGSRIQNWDIQITDTIADNASSSHFVLGENRVKLDRLNLETCQMTLLKNSQLASQGSGKDCLENPLNAVLWLAQKMQSLNNPLLKNDIILSGALGPMVVIEKGDQLSAEISDVGAVSFSVS